MKVGKSSGRRVSFERLQTILRRQEKNSWGSDYQPCTRAVPSEAPPKSRPAIISSEKFGRDIHLLSEPELFAAILALYHPSLQGLQEQRMLSPVPCPHPLFGCPGVVGGSLPPLLGTLDVAERLGCLDAHPFVWGPDPNDATQKIKYPYPYQGDLLLLLVDHVGPYCVNWSIKANSSGFYQPFDPSLRQTQTRAAAHAAMNRHSLEEIYYADGGMRTVRIAQTDFDIDVINNLIQAYGYTKAELTIEPVVRAEILYSFEAAINCQVCPLDVINHLFIRKGYPEDVCRTVLHQGVWQRQLRIDLHQPLLVNRPLQRETRDLLDEFEHWFAR